MDKMTDLLEKPAYRASASPDLNVRPIIPEAPRQAVRSDEAHELINVQNRRGQLEDGLERITPLVMLIHIIGKMPVDLTILAEGVEDANFEVDQLKARERQLMVAYTVLAKATSSQYGKPPTYSTY